MYGCDVGCAHVRELTILTSLGRWGLTLKESLQLEGIEKFPSGSII